MTRLQILDRLASFAEGDAIVTGDLTATYAELLVLVETHRATLRASGVGPGSCLALPAVYTPAAVALLLAAFADAMIAIPLATLDAATVCERLTIACCDHVAELDESGRVELRPGPGGDHELLTGLQARREPGLVLFSSGSSGPPKAALLSVARLLSRYARPGASLRTLVFLSFDHIGGVNTLLYTLSHGGVVIVPGSRTPDATCAAIKEHDVELLPTTPTFLNLMLMSDALSRQRVPSLRLITYGTECMPQTTLSALHEALPHVTLKQTYGSTELGILRTRSEHSSSRWFEVVSEDYEIRTVDGLVEVRSRQRMEGYLNAPQPFDADGWCRTGDVVERRGDYLRVLGRASEIINVGGEKVAPSEVEDVILGLDNVEDVVVMGRPNPVTGQIVMARVRLADPENPEDFEDRLRTYCAARLADHEVPLMIEVTEDSLQTERFKRSREQVEESA